MHFLLIKRKLLGNKTDCWFQNITVFRRNFEIAYLTNISQNKNSSAFHYARLRHLNKKKLSKLSFVEQGHKMGLTDYIHTAVVSLHDISKANHKSLTVYKPKLDAFLQNGCGSTKRKKT